MKNKIAEKCNMSVDDINVFKVEFFQANIVDNNYRRKIEDFKNNLKLHQVPRDNHEMNSNNPARVGGAPAPARDNPNSGGAPVQPSRKKKLNFFIKCFQQHEENYY